MQGATRGGLEVAGCTRLRGFQGLLGSMIWRHRGEGVDIVGVSGEEACTRLGSNNQGARVCEDERVDEEGCLL